MELDQTTAITAQIGAFVGSVITSYLAYKEKQVTRSTKQTKRMFVTAIVTGVTALIAMVSLVYFATVGSSEIPGQRMVVKLANDARKIAIESDIEIKADPELEKVATTPGNEPTNADATGQVTPNPQATATNPAPENGSKSSGAKQTVFASVMLPHRVDIIASLDEVQKLAAAFLVVYPECTDSIDGLSAIIEQFRKDMLLLLDEDNVRNRLMGDVKNDLIALLSNFRKGLDKFKNDHSLSTDDKG